MTEGKKPRYNFTDAQRRKGGETRKRELLEVAAFKARTGKYKKLADAFSPAIALGLLAEESVGSIEAQDRIRAAQAYLRETRESGASVDIAQRSRLIDEQMGTGEPE